MDKQNRNKWTNKFRELGKKKGSRQDFIKLYKEMKKDKEKEKNNQEACCRWRFSINTCW